MNCNHRYFKWFLKLVFFKILALFIHWTKVQHTIYMTSWVECNLYRVNWPYTSQDPAIFVEENDIRRREKEI